jgi:hypothetical protein
MGHLKTSKKYTVGVEQPAEISEFSEMSEFAELLANRKSCWLG